MQGHPKTVTELSNEELDELRKDYFQQLKECADDVLEGIKDYKDIPNYMLFYHYQGVLFEYNDFLCNELPF